MTLACYLMCMIAIGDTSKAVCLMTERRCVVVDGNATPAKRKWKRIGQDV